MVCGELVDFWYGYHLLGYIFGILLIVFVGGAVAGGLLGEEAGGGPQPDGRRHRLGGRRHPRHPSGEYRTVKSGNSVTFSRQNLNEKIEV